MKGFVLDAYGKGTPLRLTDLPEPEVGNDDVLVEVHAAGLNQLDAKIRDGAFKPILPYRTPLVLGHDVAGRVTAVGANVTRFKTGDDVYARPRDGRIGAFAERIAIHQDDVALKPANLSMEDAAGVPLTALTAWQVLVDRTGVTPGDKVLIHAGSGGVGIFAIQLAKHLGATVATTAGVSGADLVRSLGADVVIDYRTEDFTKVLSGYDVVLNSLDGETLERSLDVLKPGGKLISISGPPDPAFAEAQGLNWIVRQIIGLGSRKIRSKARARGVQYSFLFMKAEGAQLGRIAERIEAGDIRTVNDRTFPFEALNEALAYVETGRAKGKVVVSLKAAQQ
ncbi:NADP-dependent oxidoreductase [Brevundimonas variabilis]|uniref:NADPH:quinone reductase-like Zn-dependent oxidoreductase n=1 Tax=Brevundimonas variabilis TaxID=74312 RepID=A0A7W9CJ71_9CAUL|nr:NADP-dependent oxidoreductase [Brevundimonas variabilis]MBB5746587.1 NADPH:quinone reductase-like Zn-dependent oxidoreductase [Brevundimonas variabilis]